jgi:hypothetical protein
MPMGAFTGRPIEYFMLNGARPSGLTIGSLGDRAISEFVTDYFGKRYRYVGLAPRKWNGAIDVDRLGAGEFILPPCLVYRRDAPSGENRKMRLGDVLASVFAGGDRGSGG